MASYKHCIELVFGAHLPKGEAGILKKYIQQYREEDYPAKEANVGAVRDFLEVLQKHRKEIIDGINAHVTAKGIVLGPVVPAVPPVKVEPTEAKKPSPISKETGKMGSNERPWHAGKYKGKVQFASDTQRDLFDLAAALRGVAKSSNYDAAMEKIRSRTSDLASVLKMTEHETVKLAQKVGEDVRSQMKGLKNGETRAVVDNVRKAKESPPTSPPATPEAEAMVPSIVPPGWEQPKKPHLYAQTEKQQAESSAAIDKEYPDTPEEARNLLKRLVLIQHEGMMLRFGHPDAGEMEERKLREWETYSKARQKEINKEIEAIGDRLEEISKETGKSLFDDDTTEQEREAHRERARAEGKKWSDEREENLGWRKLMEDANKESARRRKAAEAEAKAPEEAKVEKKFDYEMTQEEYLADERRIFEERPATPRTLRQEFPENARKRAHKDSVERALHEHLITPERAEELGHFKAYPDLKPAEKGKAGEKESAEKEEKRVFPQKNDISETFGMRYTDSEGTVWEIVAQNDLGVPYFSKVVKGKVQKKQFTIADGREIAERLRAEARKEPPSEEAEAGKPGQTTEEAKGKEEGKQEAEVGEGQLKEILFTTSESFHNENRIISEMDAYLNKNIDMEAVEKITGKEEVDFGDGVGSYNGQSVFPINKKLYYTESITQGETKTYPGRIIQQRLVLVAPEDVIPPSNYSSSKEARRNKWAVTPSTATTWVSVATPEDKARYLKDLADIGYTTPPEPVAEGTAEAEGPPDAYNYKSKGHVAFFKSPDGPWFELFKDAKGDLYRARDSAVIDMDTKNRIGRFEAPAHMADKQVDVLLGKEEQKPTAPHEPETPFSVEVTKEDEKAIYEVRLGKRVAGDLNLKQQKTYLLKEVDVAIAAAKKAEDEDTDVPGRVRFEVPGDGVFEINNSKEALAAFKKNVASKFPTAEVKPKATVKKPSIKSLGHRLSGEVEYYNEFEPRSANINVKDLSLTEDGFLVDEGQMAWAVKPSQSILGQAADLDSKVAVNLSNVIGENGDKHEIPATIVAEYNLGHEKDYPLAHVTSEGKSAYYNARFLDIILTQHPDAKPFVAEDFDPNGTLVFKVGNEAVGVVSPVNKEYEGAKIEPTAEMLSDFAERTAPVGEGKKKGERFPQSYVNELYEKGVFKPIAKAYRSEFAELLGVELSLGQTEQLMVEMMQQGKERGEAYLINDASPRQPLWSIVQAWDVVKSEGEGKKANATRIVEIKAKLAKLQAQYEKKMAGDEAIVPPAIKKDALTSITKQMDKLDAELAKLEGKEPVSPTILKSVVTSDQSLFGRKVSASEAKGMPITEVEGILKEIIGPWKSQVVFNLRENISEVPKEMQDDILRTGGDLVSTVAFLDRNGEVWILSGKLADRDHLERTVLHEVIGHLGVIRFLGDRLHPVLDEIYAKYGRDGLQSIATDWGLNLSKAEDRRIAAFEKLATMAEQGREATFLQRVYAVIRRFLKRMGFKVKMSDGEMLELLRASRQMIVEGKSRETAKQGQPLFMREPVKTVKAYKLFRTLKGRPGEIFPLFIGKNKPTPIGEWIEAEFIPTKGFAERPGWHVGSAPSAPHLMTKTGEMQAGRVWAEVEIPADVDWQSVASKSPGKDIKGEVPAGGHYVFKRPSSQGGEWLIGGAMKVNRILSAEDVKQVLAEKERTEFMDESPDILFSRLRTEATPEQIEVAFGKNTDMKGWWESRIPAWIARVNEFMNRAFRVQEDRNSNYNKESLDLLAKQAPINDLSKADRKTLDKFTWKRDRKKIAEITADKFKKVGERTRTFGISKEVRTFDVLELNDEHYEQMEAYMEKKGLPKNIRDAYIIQRKSFDEMLLVVYETMQNIEKIDPNLIEKYRQSIGSIENYFPHFREGNWHITALDPNAVADKDQTDDQMYVKVDGKSYPVKYRRHFNAFSERGARRWKQKNMDSLVLKEARQHDPNLDWTKLTWKMGEVKGNPEEMFNYPIPLEAMQQIADQALARMEMPDTLTPLEQAHAKEAFRHLYAEAEANILKVRGFMQHFVQSRNIPGFEKKQNARAMQSYTTGLVGMITKMDAAHKFGDILRDINAKNDPKTYQMILRYVSDMLQNTDRWDKFVNNLRTFFFVKYLGLVIKTSVLNLTQNVIAGQPTLAMHMGWARSNWYLTKAMKDIALSIHENLNIHKEGSRLSQLDKLWMRESLHEGWTQARLLSELMGKVGTGPDRALMKAIRVAGWPMEVAEKFNRQSMGLAAFRAMMEGKITNQETLDKYGLKKGEKAPTYEPGHESPEFTKFYEAAKKFSHEDAVEYAHFAFSKGNRPQLFRGSRGARLAASTYTFRSFNHNLFSMWRNMLGHQGQAGKRAFAYSIGNMILLAGLSGIPFYRTLATAIRQLFGKDPLGEEILKRTPNMLRDFVLYGAPTFLGIDLSGSIGMEIPGLGRRRIGESTAQRVTGSVGDLIGVPWAVLQELTDAMDAVAKGRLDRVPEIIAPIVVKNVLSALRLSSEGATALSGKPIARPGQTEPTKLTTREAIGKALGFQPISKTREFQLYRTLADLQTYKASKQTEWANELAVATRKHDTAKVREVNKELREYNADMRKSRRPEMVIDLKDALKARMKPQQTPKPMRTKELELADLYQLRDNLKKR
jgi:hypothetical protein